MENQDTNQSLFDLHFDENVKQNLKGAATWAGIAAIISIAGSFLGLISYFIQKGKPKTYQFEGFQEMRAQTERSTNIVSVILTLIIGLFLFYFLNRFARITKAGIDSNNQQQIGEGLGNLSSYFRIIGVLFIIGIIFFCLALLIGIGSKV
jgi:ABC-type Fe3+ transport system permease subunit